MASPSLNNRGTSVGGGGVPDEQAVAKDTTRIANTIDVIVIKTFPELYMAISVFLDPCDPLTEVRRGLRRNWPQTRSQLTSPVCINAWAQLVNA